MWYPLDIKRTSSSGHISTTPLVWIHFPEMPVISTSGLNPFKFYSSPFSQFIHTLNTNNSYYVARTMLRDWDKKLSEIPVLRAYAIRILKCISWHSFPKFQCHRSYQNTNNITDVLHSHSPFILHSFKKIFLPKIYHDRYLTSARNARIKDIEAFRYHVERNMTAEIF